MYCEREFCVGLKGSTFRCPPIEFRYSFYTVSHSFHMSLIVGLLNVLSHLIPFLLLPLLESDSCHQMFISVPCNCHGSYPCSPPKDSRSMDMDTFAGSSGEKERMGEVGVTMGSPWSGTWMRSSSSSIFSF